MNSRVKPKRQRTHDGKENPQVKDADAQTPSRTLSENEWNFNEPRVSDSEVEICCYWEYARESTFILSVRERCFQIAGSGLDFAERQKFVGVDFRKIRDVLGRKAHLFQEGIYTLGGATSYEKVPSPFPQPWQSLPPDMRRILLETAEWTVQKVVDFPAFRWSESPRVSGLAEHLRQLHLKPKEPKFPLEPNRAKSLDDLFWSGSKPRTERPSFMYVGGTEVLLVEIEWGRFNNEQIIECFRKWVRIHRPKDVKAPSGQGHKDSDWRAALNRLGIMRALNAYTFADHRFPQPLKERDEKTCYAARKEAGKTFQRLFHFLPVQEKPIHWKTKGGKAR
jgi:hypothetical protein